jgi:hypothetical protein
MMRFIAMSLFVAGIIAFVILNDRGHQAIGFAVLIASGCASIVVSVVAFVRDPDKWPDDVPRFPPD